jgi:hypothetical protein
MRIHDERGAVQPSEKPNAYSDANAGSGRDQPQLMVRDYGRGRVLERPLPNRACTFRYAPD